ncbi:hypothetical protein ACQCSX_22135 (plasmid) [Pseudarthrobacter sp. P1]|uniref:hypothetical protein n=1 Tax=Pseudarthrobacter sp. P1 TaxID=3418418 RepID=UPI003CFA5767
MSAARQPAGIPSGGQFAATTHAEPGIVLGAGYGQVARFVTTRDLFEREVAAATGGAEQDHKHPERKAEAKRLLVNTRGERDGKVRHIHLDSSNSPDAKIGEHVQVVGPKDGRPIIVSISSGLPRLKVTSGTAIIRADSRWGNSVSVGPGAEAIIIADADSKVTTEVDPGGKATFVCASANNRFHAYPRGDAIVDLSHGTDTDRIRYVPHRYDFTGATS